MWLTDTWHDFHYFLTPYRDMKYQSGVKDS